MSHPAVIVKKIDRKVIFVIAALLLITTGIVTVRLYLIDFDLDYIMPKRVYTVNIVQSFNGHGGPVELNVFVPENDHRQRILEIDDQSRDLTLESFEEKQNRRARWRIDAVTGERQITYTLRLSTKAVRYDIDDTLTISDVMHQGGKAYLAATDAIQSNAPEIQQVATGLIPEDGRVSGFLRAVFDYVSDYKFKAFKGTTDALTALRLGEASCNGKSRLVVAILRSQGIAARLVGGLVMTPGVKKTSHQWVEAYVGGHWVPLDPTNDHFLEIPDHYLALYRGDHVLFKHSSDIGFKYHFAVSQALVPAQEVAEKQQVLGFTHIFRDLGIPMALLKSIIMIPLGAVIVVIFRNVIGLHTFGTFLPALIAVACRSTGLVYGLIGFTAIILTVSLVRHAVSKLQLLHSPQLGVLLTVVIALLLLFAVLGAMLDLNGLAKVTLFPIVIVAITAERFSITEIEEGRLEAWKIMVQTLVVVSMCYVVMRSLSLQVIMLGFPELMLVIVALNIWIGRWVGLRATEWLRFRRFVFQDAKQEA